MKKFIFGSITVLAAMLLVFACGSAPTTNQNGAPYATVTINDRDFQSEPSGKLKINNMSGVELAIFVGRVEKGNLIGAIGTGANGHPRSRQFDLNKIAGLPQKGTLLFRATSFQTFNKKGLAGVTEEDVIYTGLIAFDRSSPDSIEQDIFRNIDGSQQTFIHVTNRSPYVLQLRLDSSDGDTVAVLAPGQRLKKLWISGRDDGLPYEFFPTYVYVDPKSGEMNAFSDKENVNGKRFEPEPAGTDVREITFTGPSSGGPQYNVAFIRLQNDTDSLLNFMTAEGNYKKNDRGTVNTSPGRTDTYQIDSSNAAAGRMYTAAGIRSDSGFSPIGRIDVLPGHIYELVVTNMNGTYQAAFNDVGIKSIVDSIRVDLFGE
ncbi:hypothetical protein AGMMS50268_09870 [Spirochaetia bacterium]|nr:hypothetical protein AGMMS50268_09870 [Spirochaetia bacterium]